MSMKLNLMASALTVTLLLAGCQSGLSEREVQSRIDAGVAKAIASIPTPTTLKVQRLEVVDKTGKLAALLTTLETGRPTLALMDPTGEARAWMFLSEDGSPRLVLANRGLMVLTDASGEFRAITRLDAKGVPTIGLGDSAGTLRSILRLSPDGSPVLLFNDQDDKTIWSAPPIGPTP